MLRHLVEIRDAGARGCRGLFALSGGVPAGTTVIQAEPPAAYAAASQGDEDDALVRLVLSACLREKGVGEILDSLCRAELPEDATLAAKRVAEFALQRLSSGGDERSSEMLDLSVVQDILLRFFCNVHAFDDGAIAVYLEASAINHDCDPNCTFFAASAVEPESGMAGALPAASGAEAAGAITVRALRDIAPGEELTIGYVPLRLPKRLRTPPLLRNYGFACQCARCEAEEEEELDDSEAAEKALTGLAAKMRRGIDAGAAAEDPSPLARLLQQAKQLARFQTVLASQLFLDAAEAFVRASRPHAAALALHDVLIGLKALPFDFVAPFRASVSVRLCQVLLRLATNPASTPDESRVALSRAATEAKAAAESLRRCRGEDHEATVQAESLVKAVSSLNAARKEASLLGKLMERHQGRLAQASAAGAAGPVKS